MQCSVSDFNRKPLMSPLSIEGSKKKHIMNIMQQITNNVISELSMQLDNAIIEGLRKKGYQFESEVERNSFAKEHIEINDYVDKQERVYFAKGIPFFIHYYGNNSMPEIWTNKITMSYGEFAYL